MLYMVTFTINIPPMLAYIPYMDPMGSCLMDSGGFIPCVITRQAPDLGQGVNDWDPAGSILTLWEVEN
jgi:hypothetical protein